MKSRLLQIAQLGNPVLKKKAKVVKNIKDKSVQELIDDMLATVMDVNGVGLAAPQVYQSLQIFIMASHPNPRYPNAPFMKPTAVVNPKILEYSKERERGWEGCLSVPGIRGFVPRSVKIKVEYVTRTGKRVQRGFSGFLARIFQHELDHLKGIMFIDRVESAKDLMSEKEWRRLMDLKQKEQLSV